MDNRKVLIVEDNPLNMKLVKSLLQISNYDIFEAVNAEQGIELATKERPDLILMDIQLPGMDGLTATQKILSKPELSHVPVVALTSYAMQGDEQRALDAGCAGYFTKPINTRSFVTNLEKYFVTQPQPSHPAPSSEARSKPRILIVDDDPLNVKMLSAQLPEDRYDICGAYGGAECIAKVHDLSPDLILLDIMMPEINGYEVTTRLKKHPRTQTIPIILVTALDGAEDKARGLEAGADEFLTKPVNTTELQARVSSMLRLKTYHEQLTIRTQSAEQFVDIGQSREDVPADKLLPRLLLVEDNIRDRKLIHTYLESQPYEILVANSGEQAISMAMEKDIDLILLDIVLPGLDGFEVCHRLKGMDETKNIQVVMVTCLSDLDSKIIGVERGADDFLVKPINKRELQARVKSLLKKKCYLDQICSHYELALNSAITDGLTGLYNHAYFICFLELEIKRSLRQNYSTALIMLDLDDFKQYNDELGHMVGDQILREVAQVIRSETREIDVVARYGGEEFAAILPYAEPEGAAAVAERIRNAIKSHNFSNRAVSTLGTVTASLGVAYCPHDAAEVRELIQKADEMLYKAKRNGKDRVCIFNECQPAS